MSKKDLLNLKESDILPFNFHYLEKETIKVNPLSSFMPSHINQGEIIVGDFYKKVCSLKLEE